MKEDNETNDNPNVNELHSDYCTERKRNMAEKNIFERFSSNGKPKDGKAPKPSKIILWCCIVIVAVIAVIALSQSTYQIREQEQGVLVTFGKARAVTEPGLHFKVPFIQNVIKVNTTIQGFPIGYSLDTDEYMEDESLMITSDYNFVNVDFFVEYRISDPVKATFASEDPVGILKNISQSCIRNVIGSYDVDSVLTSGKNEIQASIREMVVERLEERDMGIQLVNITIQDSEPPTEDVMQAFKAVETAKQGKETALNNAQKYRNEQIPAAQAEADKIKQLAEAEMTQRINQATAEVAVFNATYAEYIKNPLVTKRRMFYETMEELLPELTVIIDSGDGSTQKVIPIYPYTFSIPGTTTDPLVTLPQGEEGDR